MRVTTLVTTHGTMRVTTLVTMHGAMRDAMPCMSLSSANIFTITVMHSTGPRMGTKSTLFISSFMW